MSNTRHEHDKGMRRKRTYQACLNKRIFIVFDDPLHCLNGSAKTHSVVVVVELSMWLRVVGGCGLIGGGSGLGGFGLLHHLNIGSQHFIGVVL